MEYGLYICLTLAILISAISIFYTIKFAILILKIQDDIEYSLDMLDESFSNINKILEKPIFFDSIEVRQCVNEIKKTRAHIVKIADRLTSFGNSKVESKNLLENTTGGSESERQKKDSQL